MRADRRGSREARRGDFFTSVRRKVSAVPAGRVATYGQIARLLGDPRAARMVGWALHALPQATDVPWHRVINARGRISASGREHAARLQAEILRDEGVEVTAEGEISLERFLWIPDRPSRACQGHGPSLEHRGASRRAAAGGDAPAASQPDPQAVACPP